MAIVGRGAKTVIDLCRDNSIEISANHCTLSNLKVAFSSFGSSVISLRGSQNEINDIEVTHYLNVPVVSQDASFWDIIIEGSHNILQRVKINCSIFENFYIVVTKYATNVVISDLLVTKGRVEVYLYGQNNTLRHSRICEAISLSEILRQFYRPTELLLFMKGLNCTIEEIKCTYVEVEAGSLTNVECGGTIMIVGNPQGIILKGCKAKTLCGGPSVAMNEWDVTTRGTKCTVM